MLIEGALSIFVAILAYFLLPNWANNTPWLLPEETEMAQYRLVLSAGGIDEADSKLSMFDGAKLAVKDWVGLYRSICPLKANNQFTWLFMLLHFFLIAAQSFKDFLPSIVSHKSPRRVYIAALIPQLKTMSSSSLMTYLLQSPCYLLGYLAILGFGWSSGRFKDSVWHVVSNIAYLTSCY